MTFLLMIVLGFSMDVLAAGPSEVLGAWQLEKTQCVGGPSEPFTTQILDMPILGFEPSVRLTIYERDDRQYVQKEVIGDSCRASTVDTDYFLKAIHDVNITKLERNGSNSFGMKANRLVWSDIRNRQLWKCGNILQSLSLVTLTWLKFPQHFQEESNREYRIVVHGNRLNLIFVDPELCKGQTAMMVFNKK